MESNKNVNFVNYGKNSKIVDFNLLFSKNNFKKVLHVQFYQALERKLIHYWAIGEVALSDVSIGLVWGIIKGLSVYTQVQ